MDRDALLLILLGSLMVGVGLSWIYLETGSVTHTLLRAVLEVIRGTLILTGFIYLLTAFYYLKG